MPFQLLHHYRRLSLTGAVFFRYISLFSFEHANVPYSILKSGFSFYTGEDPIKSNGKSPLESACLFDDTHSHPAGIPLDKSIPVRSHFSKCERSPSLIKTTPDFLIILFTLLER